MPSTYTFVETMLQASKKSGGKGKKGGKGGGTMPYKGC